MGMSVGVRGGDSVGGLLSRAWTQRKVGIHMKASILLGKAAIQSDSEGVMKTATRNRQSGKEAILAQYAEYLAKSFLVFFFSFAKAYKSVPSKEITSFWCWDAA